MSDKIRGAAECLARVPFPEMELGPNGTIWTKPADGRKPVRVATLNLRGLTLPEAWAFGTAFIASGEAISSHPENARRWHHSDCAVNNAPAYEPGACDCGLNAATRPTAPTSQEQEP